MKLQMNSCIYVLISRDSGLRAVRYLNEFNERVNASRETRNRFMYTAGGAKKKRYDKLHSHGA